MPLCHFWSVATKTLEPSGRGHSPLPFIHLTNIATELQGHRRPQRQPSHPAPLPASGWAQHFTSILSNLKCGLLSQVGSFVLTHGPAFNFNNIQ